MKSILILLLAAALGGCGPKQVQPSELLGRWTWQGTDCSAAYLQIDPDKITMQALNGQRAVLFDRIRTDKTEYPREIVLHFRQRPHLGMTEAERKELAAGYDYIAFLLRVDGDRIEPLIITDAEVGHTLNESHYEYGMFKLFRCT